jgi:hypothetical protein
MRCTGIRNKKLMQQNFTQDDIILYIYNELEPEKVPALIKAVAENKDLLMFYQETLKTLNDIDNIKLDPTPSVISILKEEARYNSLKIH